MAIPRNLVKIRLNKAGVKSLLKSNEVAADLKARGDNILAALPDSDGQEWKISPFFGKDRAQVVVRTANYEAKKTASETVAMQIALTTGRNT